MVVGVINMQKDEERDEKEREGYVVYDMARPS